MHKVRQAIRKHRKLLSACAMVLAIALMFWAVNSPAIVGVSAAKRVLPIYSVQRDDRVRREPAARGDRGEVGAVVAHGQGDRARRFGGVGVGLYERRGDACRG